MASSRRSLAKRRRIARPPRKPMAMARRISLFEREVSVRLAPVALDLIHGAASVLTEGELVGEVYTGSTMLTVDLAREATRSRISDPPDATTAQRVAILYASDERCREQARRIALGEARRIADCDLSAPLVDVVSRARGPQIPQSHDDEARPPPGEPR
jgi:hypothetical protein